MNLLTQILRLITQLAINLLISIIAILIRLFLPLFIAVLRIMRTLVFTSLAATVIGPSQFTDRLASEWTQRLLTLGVSRDYLDQLFSLCRFFAGSMIILGWIVATLFIVAILRVVFGLFI